ncbi:RNA-directed DNA polymerase, eukaryota, reverse transcriptase zinc-binding domain protein, partial [Tanacetum coccineum]
EFTVKSFSHAIQKKLLTIDVSDMARSLSWNSWVPRKVNICAWRVLLDRLPTRANLVHRGIQIWNWWKAPGSFNPYLEDILKGVTDFSKDKRVSKIFHAVCMTFIWHVWTWRNKIIHAASIEEANSARHEDNFSTVKGHPSYGSLIVLSLEPARRICGWYSALKIYGFTGEILWTKYQGFESLLLPTPVGAPTGQGDFPELFFVEWTTVDAKEILGVRVFSQIHTFCG